MKAIIHIGTEKTGSTSIQAFFKHNQSSLNSLGFYYVQSPGKKNNRALPAIFINDFKEDGYLTRNGILTNSQKKKFIAKTKTNFKNELASVETNIHTIIISSEHFHSRLNSIEEIKRSYEFFSECFSEIKIICYVREQVAMVSSLYSTALQAGHAVTFEEFIKKCQPSNPYYNHFEMLNSWSSIYGKENMICKIFDRNLFQNQSVISDFICTLDTKFSNLDTYENGNKNVSLSSNGQVFAAAINILATRNSKKIQKKRPELIRFLRENMPGKGFMPPQEKIDNIYKEFSNSNSKLFKTYFSESTETGFKKPEYLPASALNSDDSAMVSEFITLLLN